MIRCSLRPGCRTDTVGCGKVNVEHAARRRRECLDERTSNEARYPNTALSVPGLRLKPPSHSPAGTLMYPHLRRQPHCRVNAVRIARDVSKNGAPEEIRTPDPQIRSLGGAPVSKGQLVDHCGNELRQGHHVTSQKSACLRVTRQTNWVTSRSQHSQTRREGGFGAASNMRRCQAPLPSMLIAMQLAMRQQHPQFLAA